ncbi:MAG: DUF3048 domain-containing protein [Streptomycetaceae bacterium]|nr:MAG: DUF3048 domain-containing protein [Streptomycetaceae bacterium]
MISILAMSLLSGCSTIAATIKSVTPKPVEKNILSGREGSNGPVLVVKIDDTNAAHPQIGLEEADVVYIEQVEGGLTRLAAVFSSVIPMRIGPVRSARISDIEIMSQYGRVAFAYSGAQKKLLPVIAAANVANLGAQAQSPTIYTTDPARNSPYAMVLRADLLMQKIIDKGYVVDTAKSVGWKFGSTDLPGVAISQVVMHWPAATYSATWSEAEKRWLLSHNNEPDLSETGKRLGPTTLVIQMVSITASEYGDKFGGVTPFSNTVGTGTGYILRDGKSYTATWNRPSNLDGTTWSALDGSELTFAPGQVWVALTDREPDFTLIPASASASPTK